MGVPIGKTRIKKLQKKADLAVREPLDRPKKRYSPPQLVYYGDITKLTRGGGGTAGDGGGAMSMIPCWIAEVLYGVDAPRTRLVRTWLLESYKRRNFIGRIAVPIYARVGVRVASVLRSWPVLRAAFRPVFDLAVQRAYREFANRAASLQDR
jgi:hypothetical protein